jgi:hypothetical protein
MDKQRAYYRKYRKARDRALSRLATAYPDDYKELLEQEKANEQESEDNTGISFTVGTTGVGTRSITTPAYTGEAGNEGENQGYNGGEA